MAETVYRVLVADCCWPLAALASIELEEPRVRLEACYTLVFLFDLSTDSANLGRWAEAPEPGCSELRPSVSLACSAAKGFEVAGEADTMLALGETSPCAPTDLRGIVLPRPVKPLEVLLVVDLSPRVLAMSVARRLFK